MILYKKSFPLGEGISFFSYIKALEKKRFPNYYLRIEKILSTTNYHATIVFTASYWRSSWRNGYYERVFLKECTIQHSKDTGYFTLQASPKAGNLLFASLQILFPISYFVFEIFTIVTNGGISLNNIFGFAIVIIIMLAPLILIYLQDKNLLDKVGSIGKNLEKN